MSLNYGTIHALHLHTFRALNLYTHAATSDYDPSMVPNQALFNLSTNEQCFDVPIIDDDIPEDTENFMLSFDLLIDAEEQSPLAIVTPRMLEVEITDNDEGK